MIIHGPTAHDELMESFVAPSNGLTQCWQATSHNSLDNETPATQPAFHEMGSSSGSHDRDSVNMKRGIKLRWLLLAAAVLLTVVYFVIPDPAARGNEAKYRQAFLDEERSNQFRHIRDHWPNSLGLILPWSMMSGFSQQRALIAINELLTAGYFVTNEMMITNFPTGLTNSSIQYQEMRRRLEIVYDQQTYCHFWMTNGNLIFVSRSNDVPRIQRAANGP